MTDLERDREIRDLHRARPRRPFVRFSVGALTLLAMWAILGGSFPVRDFFSARARTNVARMLQQRGYRQFEVRRWILAEIGDGAGELDAS